MLLKENYCGRSLHFRGIKNRKRVCAFPKNHRKLKAVQKRRIFNSLQLYRVEKGVSTQSLLEYLLSICVDMAADDSYNGNAGAILPFAQSLTLIMNHAHAAGWFDGGDEWN